ncbi:hypothetical protein B0H13DRAFT_1654481 [Mycena leptocephala]|nr:hypothetical protein B0H13DRAFT_1654481 [Mycena leptocephala]
MREITPRDWADWPTRDQLVGLSRKADGLFHYAATALQWIEGQIDKENEYCRPWVFDRLTQMGGLDHLGDLYKLILTSFEDIDHPARHELRRKERLWGFRHILGTILVLHEPLTIHQIIDLLADIQKLDVKHVVQQFRSVLVPGMTTSLEEATPQMHKSFRDYILNSAPTGFRIRTGDAHFVTARSCLEVIVEAESHSDTHLRYSVQHWHLHLRQAVEEGATCEDERMWELVGEIVGKPVVGIWAQDWMDAFVNVAAAGWGLLKEVRAFPPSSVLVSLTLPSLLVPRKCVLFLHHLCWSLSLCLAVSSLECTYFSTIVRPAFPFITNNVFCLKPYRRIWDDGLFPTWDHHQSLSLPMASTHFVSGDKI